MRQEPVHVEERRSWWSGDVIALCGKRYRGGEYDTYHFWKPLGRKVCPKCDRLRRQGKGKR